MKITLNANEGRKVLDALVNVAVLHGWNEEELEEAGVIEEYSAAVDAAMEAMGLDVCVNPCDDENEELDFDEEEEFEEDEEDGYFNHDEDDEELSDDDKELADIMLSLVQEYLPEMSFEEQVDLTVNLCVQYKLDTEGE